MAHEEPCLCAWVSVLALVLSLSGLFLRAHVALSISEPAVWREFHRACCVLIATSSHYRWWRSLLVVGPGLTGFRLGVSQIVLKRLLRKEKNRQNKRKICFKNKSARKSAREKVKGEKRVQEEEVKKWKTKKKMFAWVKKVRKKQRALENKRK